MPLTFDACYSWNGECGWSIGSLWRDWDWFGRAAVSLLVLMAANSLIILGERLYRYRLAHTQSGIFLHDATRALGAGRFAEVLEIAAKNPPSPTASIVAKGIHAFRASPAPFTDRQAIDRAERACQRILRRLTAELAQGLGTLRTIGALAPFVGMLGTCFGILSAFRGSGMQKAAAMAMVASLIAVALVIAAMGLLVGIIAVWLHNGLWRRVELFTSEMLAAEAATLEALKNHVDWRYDPEHSVLRTEWAIGMEEAPVWEEVPYDHQRPFDHQRPLLLTTWSCWILLAMLPLLRAC